MPIFSYTARDDANNPASGTLEGVGVDDVADRLAQRGLLPVHIEQLAFDGTREGQSVVDRLRESFRHNRRSVKFKSLVFFTRQLATMTNAGVPLAVALDQLATAEKEPFRGILHHISDDIAKGNAFSDAIAHHPEAFNDLYVALVHAGEVAGALDRVLNELATYLENSQAVKEKVQGALRYPIFIGGFVFVMLLGILWKLVPVFEGLYAQFNAKLPPPTVALISLSQLVRHQLPAVFGITVALVVGIMFALTNPTFKYHWDRMLLHVPVFGGIIRKGIYARFCRTLALLMGSGTPILAAVEIVGTVVRNKLYSRALEQVYRQLRGGEMLSNALAETKVFPPLIRQMAATGESAGSIDELLEKAAAFYEREIRVTADSMASIIEPILIMVLGAFVMGLLISLYLPVMGLGKMMKQGI